MFGGNLCRTLRSQCVLLLGITSVIAVVGCQRVTRTEEKIIGLWEFTGLDATGRVVFRRDHTVVNLFRDGSDPNAKWAPTAWGTWRLEGNEIVTDEEVFSVPGYLPSSRQIARMPIRDFQEEKLVRADGRADFYRIHWGAERYSQVWALFYLIASLIAFSASIYGIRKSSLRKEFVLLGIAAVVALLWSISTLVAELAQTGTLIISAVWLRSLRLPTEIFRIVCILIFTIAFAKLAFAVKARAPAKEKSSDS